MSDSFDIIVSGHICLDLFPDLKHVPAEALGVGGTLTETGPLSVSTGGAVSNTGLALHRLGARVGLMASVGDDLLGEMITSFLREQGPGLAELIRVQPKQSSSYSVVLAPRERDRSFLHYPGTNATFGAEALDYEAIGKAKIFHLGYPPLMPRLIANEGAELRAIYQNAKSRDVVTSMDMCVPDPQGPSGQADWRAILRGVLPYVDVFLPSIDEALFMLRRGEPRRSLDRVYLHELAGELLDLGAAVAGFKIGEQGLYLRTGGERVCRRLARVTERVSDWCDREHFHPAYRVNVAGTTGAGDAAFAGFLAAMLRGLPPHACIQLASAVGACNVEKVDATSGVRTWRETLARLEAGWDTLPTALNATTHFIDERDGGTVHV